MHKLVPIKLSDSKCTVKQWKKKLSFEYSKMAAIRQPSRVIVWPVCVLCTVCYGASGLAEMTSDNTPDNSKVYSNVASIDS